MVAKEILAVNPHQRIIFASAYVKETLQESVKQLKQVVELMQKPFSLTQLVDTVEDKEVYHQLKNLNVDISRIKAAEPSHELVIDLLKRLKKIKKYRTLWLYAPHTNSLRQAKFIRKSYNDGNNYSKAQQQTQNETGNQTQSNMSQAIFLKDSTSFGNATADLKIKHVPEFSTLTI